MRRLFHHVVILLLLLSCAAHARGPRDPLTSKEVDDLRDTTQDPPKRIKLLIAYARARMLAINQLRSDPKLAQDRGKQVHDLLEDFNTIAEELDDNLDMYNRQRSDLRKVMKEVVEAYSEWQVKLRELKPADSNDAEFHDYKFALEEATDSVNEGADNARELMDKQAKLAEENKHHKR